MTGNKSADTLEIWTLYGKIPKNRRVSVMSIYDFKVRTQDGEEVSLENYKGKVLLIVNTATGCGFTPQYDELQDIYELHQKTVWKFSTSRATSSGSRLPAVMRRYTAFARVATA